LEDQRAFENTEVEKAVTSPDSNRKILAEIKKYAEAHQAKYGRFPKTLIFAANDAGHTSHANELVELAREEFGRGESFVQKCTGVTAEPPEKPSRTIEQVIEDIWANRDRDYNIKCLVRRLQRIDKEMSADARPLFAAFGIPDGDVGKYAAGLVAALKKDSTADMTRLRDKAFQALLTKYPRKHDPFI